MGTQQRSLQPKIKFLKQAKDQGPQKGQSKSENIKYIP